MNELLPLAPLQPFAAAAHVDTVADAMAVIRERSLPRHRARRARWKPSLEPVHAQHADDGDALLG